MSRNTGAKSSSTVTVACKYPGGLILKHYIMKPKIELVMGGGTREIMEAVATGRRVVINGPACEPGKRPLMRSPKGTPVKKTSVDLAEGFALTYDVPADIWNEWLATNRDSDMVKNGLIFASNQASSIKAQARSHEGQRTGLEPIDPENPGGNIEMADEMKSRKAA